MDIGARVAEPSERCACNKDVDSPHPPNVQVRRSTLVCAGPAYMHVASPISAAFVSWRCM